METPNCPPTTPTPAAADAAPKTGFPGEDLLKQILPAEVDPILVLVDDIADGGSFDTENIWNALEATAAIGRKASRFLAGAPKVGAVPQAAAEANSIPAGTITERVKAAMAAAPPVVKGDGPPTVALNPLLASLLIDLATQAIGKLLDRLKNR